MDTENANRVPTNLKIGNLDRVSTLTKIVATSDVKHPILGTIYGAEQGVPKSIRSCLPVSEQFALFELVDSNLSRKHAESSSGYSNNIYRFGVIICGPKNRVCEIKSGHDFCWYRSSIQIIYF